MASSSRIELTAPVMSSNQETDKNTSSLPEDGHKCKLFVYHQNGNQTQKGNQAVSQKKIPPFRCAKTTMGRRTMALAWSPAAAEDLATSSLQRSSWGECTGLSLQDTLFGGFETKRKLTVLGCPPKKHVHSQLLGCDFTSLGGNVRQTVLGTSDIGNSYGKSWAES